jgi:hypothetical protein
MIYFATAYHPEKNMGACFNTIMEGLNNDDWACFTDADAMFTTSNFGDLIQAYIDTYPKTGLFTSMTNRVMNTPQLHGSQISNNFDMKHHFRIGAELAKKGTQSKELSKSEPISGVLLLISKRAWKEAKFKDGQLGVDNQIHFDLLDKGFEVRLMQSVYMLHWYRGFNINDKSHLI